MRAIYIPEFKSGQKIVNITDTHHLLNVVKLKENDEVLIMNGQGIKAKGIIQAISKKQATIAIDSEEFSSSPINLHLATCLVKKEAMEDIIRMGTEIGFKSITPLQSQYSWHSFLPETRTQAIIESAMEQSNNALCPQINALAKLMNFDFGQYDHVFYFSSNPKTSSPDLNKLDKKQNILVLIGPEGGLSEDEEQYLFRLKNLVPIHLPTPILRAPTATLVASGFVLSKML